MRTFLCLANSVFISVINQLDAKIFVLQKVYFMSLHVSSTCAHHQVKIAIHSLWYHQAYRWPSGAWVERGLVGMNAFQPVLSQPATYWCDDTRGGVMQF